MKGIKISRKKVLKKPSFADGKVIVADSENAQVSIHSLKTVTSKYGLKISTGEVKTVAFTKRDPVRSKIVISNFRTSEHFNLPRLLYFLPE